MHEPKQGMLSIESKNIFSILKRWLYSEQDIVFRELISNAMDAVEKRQSLEPNHSGRINVSIDGEKRQLRIQDNGIGMSAEEVDKYINQIAFSGAEDFIAENAQGSGNIIGHFGVGFYSAFMLADHVSIETKSMDNNNPAVLWNCDGDMKYSMTAGSRKEAGTDVILHLPEDSPYLQNPEAAWEAIRKYFIFAKTPILFTAPGYDSQRANPAKPLWQQAKEDIDPAAMDAFYQDFFQDSTPPLSWFQFSSMDLGLRGILYFRNTKNGADELDGTVKVYCRGVYVGENIKGLIPKFVNLQNGIIECDQLPLVVSRGDLRNEKGQDQSEVIALVNECLVQEVAIELNDMFTNRRDQYEECWPELNAFVKYAVMQDKTMASVMLRKIIFQDLYGTYHSIPEYSQGEPPRERIYYASDALDQARYIQILQKLGENALLFDHVIDQPLLLRLETVYPKIAFIRIDSKEVAAYRGPLQDGDEERVRVLEARLQSALGKRLDNISLEFTRMASPDVTAMIVNDEQSRRMADMMEIYGYIDPDDSAGREKRAQSALLLNLSSTLVQFLYSGAEEKEAVLVAEQIFDLALLSQQLLKPEDMNAFLDRSESLLQLAISG